MTEQNVALRKGGQGHIFVYSQPYVGHQNLGLRTSGFFLISVWIFGFLVSAGPAFEQMLPGIYRHLTPFYFSGILFLFVMFEIKYRGQSRVRLPLWLMVVLWIVVLIALMAFPSHRFEDGFAAGARWMYVFLVIASFWHLQLDTRGMRFAMHGFVLGVLFLAMVILQMNGWRLVDPDLMLGYIDRNLIASTMWAGFLAVAFLHREAKYRLSKLLYTAIMLFFGYLTLMSYSRSVILIVIMTLLVFGFIRHRAASRRSMFFVLAIALFMASNVAMNYSGRLLLDQIQNPYAFSEGRTAIWRGVLEGLPSTHFLGAGSGNLREVLAASPYYLRSPYGMRLGVNRVAHSVFLKLLGENGLLGALGYLLFTGGMMRFAWQVRQQSFWILATAIFCTVFGFFFDYVYTSWFIFAVFVSPYGAQYYRQKNSQLQQTSMRTHSYPI